eukprot:Rmarinus@m.20922
MPGVWGKLAAVQSNARNILLSFPLGVIGRQNASLGLDHQLISSKHFRIGKPEDGEPFIEDLSANGTFINGQRLPKGQEKMILKHGDVIVLVQPTIACYQFVDYSVSQVQPPIDPDLIVRLGLQPKERSGSLSEPSPRKGSVSGASGTPGSTPAPADGTKKTEKLNQPSTSPAISQATAPSSPRAVQSSSDPVTARTETASVPVEASAPSLPTQVAAAGPSVPAPMLAGSAPRAGPPSPSIGDLSKADPRSMPDCEPDAFKVLDRLKVSSTGEGAESVLRDLITYLKEVDERSSFYVEFLDLGGVTSLADLLAGNSGPCMRTIKKGSSTRLTDFKKKDDGMLQACVRCIEAVMAYESGIVHVLKTRHAVRRLAALLDSSNPELDARILRVLGGLCVYSGDAREAVIDSLEHLRKVRYHQSPYQWLISECLSNETSDECLENCMVLINALIIGASDTTERVLTRDQFEHLGISSALDALRGTASNSLLTQFDIYEDTKVRDEEQTKGVGEITDPVLLCSKIVGAMRKGEDGDAKSKGVDKTGEGEEKKGDGEEKEKDDKEGKDVNDDAAPLVAILQSLAKAGVDGKADEAVWKRIQDAVTLAISGEVVPAGAGGAAPTPPSATPSSTGAPPPPPPPPP